jgi:hypothetical protein
MRIALDILRWKIKAHARVTHFLAYVKEQSGHKRMLSVFLLYVFLYWLFIFNRHIPSPGKAVAVLGVAAAVMTLMGEMKRAEKFAWILILFGLLSVEVISIDVERTAHEQEQQQARNDQLQHFSEIGNGIRNNIKESDRNFNETMKKENQVLDNITGGETFCVIEAIPIPDRFVLDAIAVGSNPLHDVLVDHTDSDAIKSMIGTPQFTFDAIQGITAHYTIPFLTSASGLQLAQIPTGNGDKRNFHFNFFSMNGMWREDLKLRRLSNGVWMQAFKVSKDIPINGRQGREVVLCRTIPKEFPITKDDDSWLSQRSSCPM